MVAQQQHRPPAGTFDDAPPLFEMHGDALEVVIRDLPVQLRRIEIENDSPSREQHTAIVGVVCTCITQCASGSAAWIALWNVKPAGLIGQSE